METFIWVIAILAVVVIMVIYIITSVGSYSDSFAGKFLKNLKDTEKEKDKEKS